MAIWGSECGLVRESGKMVSTVYAKNGKESNLYKQVLDFITSLPKDILENLRESFRSWQNDIVGDVDNNRHLALALYIKTKTDSFDAWFKNGVKDENDEPVLRNGMFTNDKGENKSLFNEGTFFTKRFEGDFQRTYKEDMDVLGDIQKAGARKRYLESLGAKVHMDSTGLRIEVDPENVFFQKDRQNARELSTVTVDKWKQHFKNMGVDYDATVKGIKDEMGNFIDANESVDVVNRIVRVVDGNENVAIGEAGMHIVTQIVKEKNPGLYSQMMNRIGSYKLYEDVVAQYGNLKEYQTPDGKLNVTKLKEETIGKVLNEYYAEQLEGSSDTTSKLLEQTQTWWDKIKSFLKDFFQGNPFTKVTEELAKGSYDEKQLKQKVNEIRDIQEGENFSSFKNNTINNFLSAAADLPDNSAIVTHGTAISLLKTWKENGYLDENVPEDKFNSNIIDNGHIEHLVVGDKNIYLIRHGESQKNVTGELSTANTPLTEKGIQDAISTAKELQSKNISVIVSTDTERTTHTADIIKHELGVGKERLFHQLSSTETQSANKDLDDHLLNYMSTWGVKAQQIEDMKKRFGIDTLGVADILNKMIYYSKDRKLDTIAEESSHILSMLMGANHPVIREMLNNIENHSIFKSVYDKYMPIYNNIEQVKKEAIDKLIADAIVNKWKVGDVPDKNIWQKLVDKIKEFFDGFIRDNKTMAQFKADKKLHSMSSYIADAVVKMDTSLVGEGDPKREELNYRKALANNAHATKIIDLFTKEFGFKLSGSLAVAGQGETIFRPTETPIHDLDFVVGEDFNLQSMDSFMKGMNAIPTHNGIFSKSKKTDAVYGTYAYMVPAEGYTVEAEKRKDWGSQMIEDLVLRDSTGKEVYRGKWDNAPADKVFNVDFFHREDNKQRRAVNEFASWQDIFFGKLILNPEEEKARWFTREKDQLDYRDTNPNDRSYVRPEFMYYQLRDKDEKKQGETNFNKLSANTLDKVEDTKGNSFYKTKATGETIPNRVTDLSHKFLEKIFRSKEYLKDKILAALNELKKAFGIKSHGHIEDIMDRAFDKKTGLRHRDNSDNIFVKEVDTKRFKDENDRFFYNKLQDHILGYTNEINQKVPGLVDQFPEGTRFMWETKVYDPNRVIDGKKGLAGTIDWMAIEPSGKVHLYDWKFIGSLERNESIRDYMKKSYDIQMENYVDILKNAYGIKDIGNVRIVPVAVKYSSKKGEEGKVLAMDIGTTQYKNETTDFLLPYVTSSEKSGDQKIDTLVQRLTGLLNASKEKKVPEQERLVRENKIKTLQKAILMIQLSKSFEPMLDHAELFNNEMVKSVDNLNKIFNETDFSKIKTTSEFNNMLLPVVEALDDLRLYSNLTDFVDFFDKNTEEGAALNRRIADVQNNAKDLYKRFENLNTKYWEEWGRIRNIRDIISPQKKLEIIGAEGRTLSKTQLTTGQAFYDLINQKQNIVDIRSDRMLSEIEEIDNNLREWGKSLGLNKVQTLKKFQSMLEQKDSKGKGINRLVSKTDKKFYELLRSNIEQGNIDWVKDNVDIEAFQKWAVEYREGQLEVIKNLPISGPKAEEIRQGYLDTLDKRTDLTGKYAWAQFDVLKKFPRVDDKINWFSKEYKEIQKNKPVKDLYDFIIKWNQEAAESGYIEQYSKEYFLPFIEKSLSEKTALGGKWNAKDKIIESLTRIKYEGTSERRDPKTGELVPSIPHFFTTDISYTDKNGETVYENISDDLVKNIGMYAHAVIDYKAKKDIEQATEALLYLEKAKGMLESDSKGKLTGKVVDQNVNYKYLEDAIKTHFYGQSVLSSFDIKGGKVSVQGQQREYSAVKAADTVKALFSFNVLGFNFTTSIFRALSTNLAGFMNAGTHYTQKEMMNSLYDFCAMRAVKNNHKLTIALMKEFMPVEENIHEAIHHLTTNKVTGFDFQEVLMKWVKSAHNIVQYTNYLSHMKNAIIIDGKLMNAREYLRRTPEYTNRYYMSSKDRATIEKAFDNKVKELTEKYGLLNKAKLDKNGKVVYDGLDMSDFSVADYKSLIRVTGRQLSGNISENDQSHIRSNALIRQMFLFTNWLPQAIDMRFGQLGYSQGKQAYEYGRMRMMARILFKDNLIPKFKSVYNMYKANEQGVDALRKMYEQHLKEYKDRTGQDLHMTEEEFFDMVRQNIKIQSRELAMMLTFAGLVMGMNSLLPNKDDEEYADSQGYFTFMKRVMNRCKDELELFYDPRKFAEFGSGSKIPVLAYFSDLGKAISSVAKDGYGIAVGDEEINEHSVMHVLHTLPVTRQMLDFTAIVDPDMADYLGIHYTSEIRPGTK